MREGLNNAATSRILDNPAVIPIHKYVFKYFYNIVYLINRYPCEVCYFQFGLRANQRLYPFLG